MQNHPPPLGLWYGVAMALLVFASARWGWRGAGIGWAAGLGVLVAIWLTLSIGSGLEGGIDAGVYTAAFGFAVLVLFLGGVWLVAGAIAAAVGMMLHAWLRTRRAVRRRR